MAEALQKHVFINCPFDDTYRPTFRAILFTVTSLGFKPRCALEVDDSSEVRVEKIMRIVEECPFGVHDISAVELSGAHQLPRFNMPFELGLFLGCKRYGSHVQQRKSCLIMDREPYRYQKFISDISGQDIRAHHGDWETAIVQVRNWLSSVARGKRLPGGEAVVEQHRAFMKKLPEICVSLQQGEHELTYSDFNEILRIWLDSAR